MCNHYRIEDHERVIEFAKASAETLGTPWEVTKSAWPKDQMPVLIQKEKRELTTARWGVWPFYEEKMKVVSNSRDDSLLKLSLWKESARKRRCLIPADGWYEWCGPAGAKWEVLFRFKDGRPFWIAGVWSQDPIGDGFGFSMVTTGPNELIKAVPHTRMIVILDSPAAMHWIGAQPLPDSELLSFCRPYPDGDLIREDQPRPQRSKAPKTTTTTTLPIDELPL